MADVVELDADGESEDDIFDDRARDLRELKVAQLQTELAKFKLSTSGKKAELIKRLLDHGWSGGGTTAAEHGCVPSKLGGGSSGSSGSQGAGTGRRPSAAVDPAAPWDELWPELSARGWTSRTGKRPAIDRQFAPRGVQFNPPW